MYFYNNHFREGGEAIKVGQALGNIEKTGGDLNSSINFPSNTRSQADNLVSG